MEYPQTPNSQLDEFFDEPTSDLDEKMQNQGGRVALNENLPPKRKEKVKVGTVLLAVGIALVSFLGGYFTHWGLLDAEMRSLINVKRAIDQNYYTEIDNDTFYGALFDVINDKLLDSYSKYMTADEYAAVNESATGKWSGLGLTFLTEDELGQEQMRIIKVSGNSPAERLGIMEGDEVVGFGAVDGEMIESRSFDAFLAFTQAYNQGEAFCVRIMSGEQSRVVTITKETFVENYVFYRSNTTAYGFGGENATEIKTLNNSLAALGQDTAYIRLTQFNGGAATQFASTMSVFKQENKKNLILDLRANGGGYLDVLCEIAAYFCKDTSEKQPAVALAVNKDGVEQAYTAKKNVYSEYFSSDSRICVLADASSASASECLLGAMLDYKTIGYADICLSQRGGVAKTFGKGIMQMTYPFGLVNTDAIKLTTSRICWPISKNCIHDRGILPEDGTKTVAENYQKDVELVAAIAALGL